MSEENKATVHRLIEEFLNTGEPGVADEVFAADYVDHNPSNPEMSGLDNVKRSVGDWHAAFPDTHNAIEDMIAEGDEVAARWVTRGTHRREFMGVLPIGNRVVVMGMGVFRFSGGKIVESWDEYDALGLLRQLGMGERA